MQRWHRRIALCVVVSYLLATHLAWVAHDHSSHQHSDCCSISLAASSHRDKHPDHDSHTHHEPGEHRHIAPCGGHSHPTGRQHEPPRAPRSDAPLPLHDPHCGACQFLALAQLTMPVAEFLPQTGEVQVLTAHVPPRVVSRITTDHPARGPPVEA